MTVVEDDTPGPSARSAAPSDGGAGTGTFADLLVTELRRVWVRRITRFLLLAVAAVIVVIWIGYAWNSRPLATSELQRMQSFYQTDLDSWQKECNDDGTLKDGVDPQTGGVGRLQLQARTGRTTCGPGRRTSRTCRWRHSD